MREIKLITAATKNSQIPQINMTQCDFLMCSDVLTDSVHLRRIWGNARHPRRTCKIQWAESTNLKKKKKKETALIIWLVSDLLCHKALLPQLLVSHNDRADTSCSYSHTFFILTEITPIDDYRSYKSTVQIMSWWMGRGRSGQLCFDWCPCSMERVRCRK